MQIRTQLQLTRSDFEVLEAAKEAVQIGGEDLDQEQLADEGEEEEEGGDDGEDESGEE